jgi:hypothetical protein
MIINNQPTNQSINQPINQSTNQILGTFSAALVLVANALSVFGLSDLMLGVLLLGVNSGLLLMSAWWCLARMRTERERLSWRRALSSGGGDGCSGVWW